jgi:MFS family permease
VVVASLVGTSLEWYDFFIYGTAAALVFNQLFFPTFDPLVGTLLAFTTFAVGFVARPLGGIVFGHYGDKVGRKNVLVATLLLMGIATFLIGLMPTYATIGVWAPILLVLLRFLQGLGLGGEWGGAVLMTLESGDRSKRGLNASWPQVGVPIGLLLANGMLSLMGAVSSDEDFLAWGWRVPFLLSGVLVLVGLWIPRSSRSRRSRRRPGPRSSTCCAATRGRFCWPSVRGSAWTWCSTCSSCSSRPTS